MTTYEPLIPQSYWCADVATRSGVGPTPESRPAPSEQESFVLVVDDDPDAREILKLVMRNIRLTVREARNEIDALDIIRTSRPSLILLDLMMPIMDGFQVLTHLRSDPQTRSIPIIVVTGIMEGCETLHLPGVSRVLVKGNFNIPQIRQIVTDALGLDGGMTTTV
jgi:CheY-like chemotaxis protein